MLDTLAGPSEDHAFLGDGGEMGRRVANFDWRSTPLGPIESWSQSLRAVVAFLLHSPVPLVMLWGEEGIMIYNDGYSRFAADNHPGILGMRVREAWPEVADFNDNVMKVGLAGGTLAYRDHVLRLNRTGVFEDVWLNLDYSPVYDDMGLPAGVLAVVVEVTDAVQSAAALRESETRLRFLDRLGRAIAVSTSADNILSIVTRMTGEELGVAICAYADMEEDQDGFTIRGDWVTEGSQSIVGRYSLAAFGELAVRNLHTGQPLIVNDNLAELPPEAAAAFRNIGIGATICMPLVKEGRLTALMAVHHREAHRWTTTELATLREVTERSWAHIERVGTEAELRTTADRLRHLNETLEARIEERSTALERSQTQFRLLVQGVTDYAIYMLDETGLVSSWNAGAERIKGYRPDEIIGRHFSSFYEEKDRESGEPARALETARRKGRFAAEGWRVRKDGTRFHASVVIDAIHDDGGALIGFAKITRDVTEREEAQRELELAREALFQSQKMEAIGQLTGGIAHDFNNLLTAIRGGLELLKKRLSGEPQTMRLLENAVKATDRGAALTQRMLAFARRQELETESVDIAQLVSGMMELLQRSLGPTFAIVTRFPGDLPPVIADINQLEMALLNLAVNARDAMGSAGSLTISAEVREPPRGDLADLAEGRYVRLTVSDDGSGMDSETLARAADPFFTTKGVGKGTGLGLSMVHGFARQIGGMLQIESRVGVGTDAHIWLPLSGVERGGDEEAPVVPDERGAGEAEVILIVDDDALILMNSAALIEDLGHVVIEANSGEEALEQLASRRDISMMITDQAMPQMTGSELIAHARSQRPDLPIILATGYGETPSDIGPAVLRLGKPFGQSDLRKAIEAVDKPRRE
ncbi:sensor/response regulator hybrid [Sphingopyxis fribergensis]|uniref:histidine kinase n=1 Tax=Sphingopyxis fribergensis TaxID=1515612 RepID=A0A0A7PGW8_9SPHN|nr:PAS domain S-box protein [Sphingopyxis fribergensis]AJA09194.1 sensor/response regulator hybrid [Sphingopyxis fribergensis]